VEDVKLGMNIHWGWFKTIGTAIISTSSLYTNYTFAQVTPDTTLPDNSRVITQENTNIIEGGTQAGNNLFHSFEQFSVANQNTVHFNNATGIQNIITRVTGKSVSNIDGLISANSNANLFLFNPNGIIFGPNAQLNIGGSFLASTASSMKFADGTDFNTKAPQQTPLLTVSVPTGLQYGTNPGRIIVRGDGQGLRATPEIIDTNVGLRVEPNQTLALIGGDVALEGGTLKTAGGRIELGSVAGSSVVSLTSIDKGWALDYADVPAFGDIQLSQRAAVDASGAGGGDIQVQGRRLTLTDVSQIEASTLGAEPGGKLEVRASESVELIGTPFVLIISLGTQEYALTTSISNQVYEGATGTSGNLSIETQGLTIRNGAQVGAGTFGAGKGGNLTVSAQTIELIGSNNDGVSSGLFASAQPGATGDAGNLTITSKTLLVTDGAQVSTSTFGSGGSGKLMLNADHIELIGRNAINGNVTGLIAQQNTQGATGNAGDLTITTKTLLVKDGAQVSTTSFGAGKSGNLTINADTTELIGGSADGVPSVLSASAYAGVTGNAGDLTITTKILLVRDGAQVGAGTFGAGDGGNLTVNANTIELIGGNGDGVSSGLFTSTEGATGNAGDLTITTKRLLIRDGAQVGVGTFGAGKGGNLMVNADIIELIGGNTDGSTSRLFASAAVQDATGDAGDLTITAKTLLVRDGAVVGATTSGAGKAGDMTVNADIIEVNGTNVVDGNPSRLSTGSVEGSTGAAGNLKISAQHLLVQNGARVSVESQGTGSAGNLDINARSIRLNNNAVVSANTRSSNVDPSTEQATININSQNLIMRRNSNISTNATGENVIGGNINIDTDVLVAVENSDISANSANFRGGNVRINAQSIFGTEFRDSPSPQTSDITATGVSRELSGNVELNTPDIDVNDGLVNLPKIRVDTEIAQGCTAGENQASSSFIITNRGGIPSNPREAFKADTVRVGWVSLNPSSDNRRSQTVSAHRTTPIPEPIVPATGWVFNDKGEVLLTSASSAATPHRAWQTPTTCGAPKSEE
jgi:filamentous hemagglutinin family protein